jgi:hypothetical protein
VLLLEKQKKNNLSVVTSASFLGDKVSWLKVSISNLFISCY